MSEDVTGRSVPKVTGGLAPSGSVAAAIPGAIVDTAAGKVRGLKVGPVHVFKGIRYGASTAGVGRFRPPVPVAPWTGVLDAFEYGPSAPQPARLVPEVFAWYFATTPSSEDCLLLNVFTPAVNNASKRPVMVWFHGGGFTTGAGTAKGFDGSNLAHGGDVVVVTVNHRLNIFGHFLPADAADDSFRDGGNAGELDLVAALRWVSQNIHRFGGDPRNVTIFGQSGGASKVAVLMAMPAAQGLFHRAIIESASSLLKAAEPQDAARAAHAVLTQLGLSSYAALRDVPSDRLLAAMARVIDAQDGYDSFRPVRDGSWLPTHPFHPTAPVLSAHIPLLIGTARDEAAFYLASDMSNFAMTRDQAVARAGRFVGLDAAAAERLFVSYETTHVGDTPSQVYIAIQSDQMYRRNDIQAAELRVQQGGATTFMYWFTWKTPVLSGVLGAPHTLEVPFAFGNVELVPEITGTGQDRLALQGQVMGAWVAFARTGRPDHAGMPEWPPYSVTRRETMILDSVCRIVADPGGTDRKTISAAPPYRPEAAGRR